MSALPDSRIVAMTLDTKQPFPGLKVLLQQARKDQLLVALLIDLQGDYPLSMPIVTEWLAVLIDGSNGITCFAVVARTTRSRLMVTASRSLQNDGASGRPSTASPRSTPRGPGSPCRRVSS